MVALCPLRALSLLRRAREWPSAPHLSLAGRTALASRSLTAQPERTGAMGAHETPNRPLAAPSPHCSSLSLAAADRPYLRQEPDAGKPPVRICGGGHEQS